MTQNVLAATTPSGRTRVRSGLELVATGIVLAAAGASGAQYRHSADSRCMGHTPSGVSLTWTFSV